MPIVTLRIWVLDIREEGEERRDWMEVWMPVVMSGVVGVLEKARMLDVGE